MDVSAFFDDGSILPFSWTEYIFLVDYLGDGRFTAFSGSYCAGGKNTGKPDANF